MSPYPTVVEVTTDHHSASNIVLISGLSATSAVKNADAAENKTATNTTPPPRPGRGETTPTTTTANAAPTGGGISAADAQQLLPLVNQARAQQGAGPLSLNVKLQK